VERSLRTRRLASRNLPVLVLLLAVVGLLVGCGASSTAGPSHRPKPTPTPIRKIMGTIREFLLGPAGPNSPSSSPGGITAGPDGNLWFTEEDGNKIGQLR